MSLLEYFNRLRGEPEEKRRRLVWLWTIAIMIVIVVGWLFTWRFNPAFSPATSRSSTGLGERLGEVKLKIITGWQTLTKTR